MTQINIPGDYDSDVKLNLVDQKANPVFGVLVVGEGTSSAFPVFYLSDATYTWYFWPTATTGVLRFGTTAPTVATRASAGSAV